jgi:hypothetical protein
VDLSKGVEMVRNPTKRGDSVAFAFMLGAALSLLTPLSVAQRPLPPVPAIIWPDSVEPDPARWVEEDVTPEQKFKTARAEAVAAHQDAQNACKTVPNEDQRLCLAQARVVFDADMQDVRQRFGDFR